MVAAALHEPHEVTQAGLAASVFSVFFLSGTTMSTLPWYLFTLAFVWPSRRPWSATSASSRPWSSCGAAFLT